MKKFNINDSNKEYIFNDNGVESIIFYYDYDKIKLLKYYRNDEINKTQTIRDLSNSMIETPRKVISFPIENLPNKEKKIKLIEEKKSLIDEVKILGPAYENEEFKGYIMIREFLKYLDYLPKNFKDIFTIKRKKIAYLKLIREKIEKLNDDGIFIGDFNEKNFLTDKNVSLVKLCDLDNFKIDELDFDTKHKFVQKFENSSAKADYIDSYCFNLFTISYLLKIDMPYLSDYLSNYKLPKFLDNKKNREILDSMIHLDSSYQKKYLIDNMK